MEKNVDYEQLYYDAIYENRQLKRELEELKQFVIQKQNNQAKIKNFLKRKNEKKKNNNDK